ncbi:MAG: hypothetical protein Aurels2KO_52500 [Aureliella sp.]
MQNPFQVTVPPMDGDVAKLELPFSLSGNLSRAEMHASLARSAWSIGLLALAVILVPVLVFSSNGFVGLSLQAIATAAIPAFVFLGGSLVRRLFPATQAEKALLSVQKTIQFTDECIELVAPGATGQWKWELVASHTQRALVGTIKFDPASLPGELVISRRWFRSDSQWRQFWDMVKSKSDGI